MPEARRFLRYVIPGLVFVSEFLIYAGILVPTTLGFVAEILKEAAGLGVVAATLLASGGLGYLFSVIHHELHWLYPNSAALDYRQLVDNLAKHGHLTLQESSPARESRHAAWIVITSKWNERLTSSERVKAADAKVMAMTDLVHATGTAFIATVFATIGAIVVAASTTTPQSLPRAAIFSVVAFLTAYAYWRSYKRTTMLARGMIEKVLTDTLEEESRV